MSINTQDLQPKPFNIELRGQTIKCKPLRLSHAMVLGKIGNILQDSTARSVKEIQQAEKDLDYVVAELIPELAGVQMGLTDTVELITKMMESIEPVENKQLKEAGVDITGDSEKKAQGNGTT